jgi:hypothetical protein
MFLAIPSARGAAVGSFVSNTFKSAALDLNFASTKSLVDSATGQNLVTFTRASSATFIDSAGTLQTAAVDVPRFDHNPTTGESLGLLVEEQRTNLLLRSQDFNDVEWATVRASISANATTSPSGTLTADKLVEDSTASNNHFTRPNTSSNVTSGVAYTFTVYVKAAERTQITIGFGTENSAFADSSGLFTLTGTGTAAAGGAATAATIQEVSNGWYRCRVSATATATAFAFIRLLLTSSGNTLYTGDGTSGLFLWGAQLEAGAFATSYIPTTAAAATRSADVASITGANFSSWYRQDEGTVFAQCVSPATTLNAGVVGFDDTTANERWRLGQQGGSTTANVVVVDNNVLQGNTGAPINSFINGSLVRIAAAVAVNNVAVTGAGLSPGVNSTATLPTVTQATIGTANAAVPINGTIRRLTYWPQRLPNSTLEAITR